MVYRREVLPGRTPVAENEPEGGGRMIAWRYIDKNAAVIAAIRDYRDMLFIIDNTPDEAKEVYDKMIAPHSALLTGFPSVCNPRAGEEKLTTEIDKIDLLWVRYGAAVEYMAWFSPAWGMLTETEKTILREYYTPNDTEADTVVHAPSTTGYSERHIRRIKAKALRRLSVLLFGK